MALRGSSSGSSAAKSRRSMHAAGISMTRKAAQSTKPPHGSGAVPYRLLRARVTALFSLDDSFSNS